MLCQCEQPSLFLGLQFQRNNWGSRNWVHSDVATLGTLLPTEPNILHSLHLEMITVDSLKLWRRFWSWLTTRITLRSWPSRTFLKRVRTEIWNAQNIPSLSRWMGLFVHGNVCTLDCVSHVLPNLSVDLKLSHVPLQIIRGHTAGIFLVKYYY